jgi:hypothetical protein
MQKREAHPLGLNYGRSEFVNWLTDIWAILTGKWSLHSAWQRGYDDHIVDESRRRAAGGS